MNRNLLATLLAATLTLPAWADDKKEEKKDDKKPALIIVDGKGKENKVTGWRFVEGARPLAWLAPDRKPDDKPDEKEDPNVKPARAPVPQGPEGLVFRDEASPNLRKSVETLIPLENLRSIDFDEEKQTMTVKVAVTDKSDDDATLTGTTRFGEFNKLTIEAEMDKGELGIAAVKFKGGVKGGIKGLRFPSPRPLTAPTGRVARVSVQGAKGEEGKGADKVQDLKVLYQVELPRTLGEKVSPTLLFKKTVRVDIAKVEKIVDAGGQDVDWTISLKGGTEETFSLLSFGEIDGKAVRLVGLLGRVPAGYRLYPAFTIKEIAFEEPARSDK
jgi:hypothetical protein